MYGKIKNDLIAERAEVRDAGLYKEERYIHGPQGSHIDVEYPENAPPQDVINFCANNYLGLSSHAEVLAAARRHNTAAPGMAPLEKALFLADKIEVEKVREDPDLGEVRRLAERDLDGAMLRYLDLHLTWAAERGWPVHPRGCGCDASWWPPASYPLPRRTSVRRW